MIGGVWNIIQDSNLDKLGGINNQKHKSLNKLKELMNLYDLVDSWRLRNNNVKRFTWRRKTPRVHCRLDFFLISSPLMDFVSKSDILPSVLSDHSPILTCIKYLDEPVNGVGHWKLNTSLLEDNSYIQEMKRNLVRWKQEYRSVENSNLKWEIIKYEIRKFSIMFSKRKKRLQQDRKDILERELLILEKNECIANASHINDIESLKSELELIYIAEAEGSIVRSRAQ